MCNSKSPLRSSKYNSSATSFLSVTHVISSIVQFEIQLQYTISFLLVTHIKGSITYSSKFSCITCYFKSDQCDK